MALTDLTEATPDTSSEEIAAYAAQVIQEVAAERQGEVDEKSDSQIIAEHSGTIQSSDTKTPAEDKSGRNTALDESEKSGKAEEGRKWLTDDVKAEAAAYGIDESELDGFASREEFDRALRLFNKKALEAGRKALDKGDEGTPRNEKGQFVKREADITDDKMQLGKTPTADQSKVVTPNDGRYQVSLNPELYDEEIIGEFNRLRDYYESRLQPFEAHLAELQEQA